MPDSLRLRPRRNWSRLDSYLHEYRKVRDDEAEDLAARIVCAAYELKRAGDNNLAMELAYELGELAILSHIYAEEDRRRKKPRQPKHDVWGELIKSMGEAASREEAGGAIPRAGEEELRIKAGDDPWLIYWDGDLLCALNDRTGIKKSIKRTTFFKYLRKQGQ